MFRGRVRRWSTGEQRFAQGVRSVLRSIVGAALIVLLACATTPERLPELDRRFYYNLPTPEDQRAFLHLRDHERQAFLERKGLWKQWTTLAAPERKAAGAGTVRVGFHEFALFMAWGPPADTLTRERDGRPSVVHTFIRCSSGPKTGQHVRNNLDCDGTSDETRVAVQEGIVVEIQYPD